MNALAALLRASTHRAPGEFAWIWLAAAALFAVSGFFAPQTVGGTSLRLMIPFASVLAIAAVGQTLVVRQRGIDLSVPAVISLSGVIVAKMGSNGPLLAAIVVAVAAGAVVGLLNGALVTGVGITPLIATLAVNALVVGMVQSYSGNVPYGVPSSLSRFALGSTFGVPNTGFIALTVVVVITFAVRKTVAGRRFVAVGESLPTARVAGVRVRGYVVGSYVVAGVCSAIAGIVLAGYVQTAEPDAGLPYLLPVIAAVVAGGTPFTGGRGSVVATAVAAVFLTQLVQLVLALGAPSSVQLIIQSGAIAVATTLRHVHWPRIQAGASPPTRRGVTVADLPAGAALRQPPIGVSTQLEESDK